MRCFGLLLFGNVLHLLMAEAQAHVAGWVRLAELCAYPVLAGLMMRRAAEFNELTRAVPAQGVNTPWTVIETCQRVADSPNVKVALQRAGVAISNVLNADVLAIGLWDEASNTIELAAVCRTGEPARSGPSFDLDSQAPSITIRQRGSWSAPIGSTAGCLVCAGGRATRPLWVQPLVHQRATAGVSVPAHTKSGWMAATYRFEAVRMLAAALSAARKAAARTPVDELTQLAHEREAVLSQAHAIAVVRTSCASGRSDKPTQGVRSR
jgi:hypothetical protein